MAAENEGEIKYTVDADIDPFVNKMGAVDSQIDKSAKNMDKVDKAADRTGKSLDATSSSAKKTADQMDKLASSTDTAADANKRIAELMEKISGHADRVAQSNSKAADATREAGAATADAGSKAGKAATDWKAYNQQISENAQQMEKASRESKESAGATEQDAAAKEKDAQATAKLAQSVQRLIGAIDPATGKVRQLENQIDLLVAAKRKGVISTQEYERYLKQLEIELGKADLAAREAATGIKAADTASTSANNSMGSLGATLKPLVAVMAGLSFARMALDMAKLTEQTTVLYGRIERLSGSAAAAESNFLSLLNIANNSGATLAETAKLWESLTMTLRGMGRGSDDAMRLTDSLQKMGAVGGASAMEMSNALRQFGQAMQGGIFRAQEFNSILELTPEIARQIAAGLGITMAELRKRMLEGKLTAEDALGAIEKQGEQINGEFAKIPKTAAAGGQAISNSFGAALSAIDRATGASAALSRALRAIANDINVVSGNITEQHKFNLLLEDRARLYKLMKADGASDEQIKSSKRMIDLEDKLRQMQERRIQEIKDAAEAGSGETTSPIGPGEEAAQKRLKAQQQEIDLLKKTGVERAKLKAVQQLDDGATPEQIKETMRLATEAYNLEQEQAAAKKATREAEAKAKKDEAKAEAQRVKDAKEAKKHTEENRDAVKDLAVQLSLAGLKGEELAKAQALLKLNKWATPEEVAQVEALATALNKVKEAQANQEALKQADPFTGEQARFDTELESLRKLNEAKLLEDQKYLELKGLAETEHQANMDAIAEAQFKKQSEYNAFLMNSIDALGATSTNVLSGVLSGTMNAQQAMQAFANTIFQQAIGALVQMGVEKVKQMLIDKSVQAAAAAGYVTSVSAQAATQSALAAQAAYASTAAIPVVGPAAAPAAATAAAMAAGALGSTAVAAAGGVAAGGRFNGGSVQAGEMYRVNEGGAPEVFNAANGSQYMMANTRGEVVSNADATSGGGGNVFHISIDASGNASGDNASAMQLAEKLSSVARQVITEETQDGGIIWQMNHA